MRRLAMVLLILFLPAVLFSLTLSVLEKPGLPAGAAQALEDYRLFRQTRLPPAVSVQASARAAAPQNFSPRLSSLSFGAGLYFQTSFSYWRATSTPLILPGLEEAGAGGLSPLPTQPYGAGGGLRPLPYPPDDLWCALVTTPDGSRHVAFAALHGDLHSAAWVVHELSWELDWPAASAALRSVKCELGE